MMNLLTALEIDVIYFICKVMEKSFFLYEQVENSSWQCCLKCQDAPFCQRASSYHEVCDGHAHPLVMVG
jgi:hypothetical protein